MSKCISNIGEYSEHDLPGTSFSEFDCNRCYAFAEDAALAEVERLRAKVARVEARLDEESPCLDRYLGAKTCDHPGCVLERDIRGILAEPERDEEGGR